MSLPKQNGQQRYRKGAILQRQRNWALCYISYEPLCNLQTATLWIVALSSKNTYQQVFYTIWKAVPMQGHLGGDKAQR